MGFVTWGLFWAGTAAVSAPILIHLLNRQKYKRIRWAAMEFLLLAFKRTRRRIQVEHLIILLLRCLALLMLGACLAQPLLGGFIVSGSRDVYVLLDDSYSMGYKSADGVIAFSRAQAKLTNIIRSLKPQDNVHVITLSEVMKSPYPADASGEPRRVTPVFEFTGESLTQQDIDQFIKDIPKLEPSDFHTDLFAGIQNMYQRIYSGGSKDQPTKELYIITDFQRNSWGLGVGRKAAGTAEEGAPEEGQPAVSGGASQDEFAKLLTDLTEPHAGVETKVFLVDAGDPVEKKENFVIEGIEVDQKELVTGSSANFEVAVRNNGFEPRNATVRFFVNGEPAGERTVPKLDPRETARVSFQRTFRDNEEGAHWAMALIEDDLAADSRFYTGFKVRKGVNILIIDGDRTTDFKSESWVLNFALHPESAFDTPLPTEKKLYIARPTIVDRLLSEKDTRYSYSEFDIVIMANVKITPSIPTEGEIEKLETYVKTGGRLVIWLGDNVDGNEYNERLFRKDAGIMPAELALKPSGEKYSDIARQERMTRLYAEELSHPIMRLFSRSRVLERQDESPSFSRYFMMRVQPTGTVVARFEEFNTQSENYMERLPAIVLKRFPNNGRVILMNTTADGEWNNMTVSPKDAIYLVLVHQMVIHLMGTEQTNVPLGPPITRSYMLPAGSIPSLLSARAPGEDKSHAVPEKDIAVENLPEQDKVVLNATLRDTFKAGPYMLQYSESGAAQDYFAVNVNAAESDLSRIDPKQMATVYTGFKVHGIIAPDKEVAVEGINTSSNIWRVPLALMVLFLALESGLALLFGRRTRT